MDVQFIIRDDRDALVFGSQRLNWERRIRITDVHGKRVRELLDRLEQLACEIEKEFALTEEELREIRRSEEQRVRIQLVAEQMAEKDVRERIKAELKNEAEQARKQAEQKKSGG